MLNAGVFRQGVMRGGGSGTGAHPPYRYVADDVRVVPKVVDGHFVVQVERVKERATALRWDDDALLIEVESASGPPAELVLTLGDSRVPVPVTAGKAAGRRASTRPRSMWTSTPNRSTTPVTGRCRRTVAARPRRGRGGGAPHVRRP